MGTVLRVKRRNSTDPQDALILCKRPKLTSDSDEEAACSELVPTVAKFAGTLKDPEENVLQHLAETLKKEEIKVNVKQLLTPCIDYLTKRRKQAQENWAENRYKVVNCLRSLDTSNIEEFEDKVLTFVDIEDSASLTENQSTAAATITEEDDKNSNYVYDLYYVDDSNSIDDCVLIHPFNEQELVYDGPIEDSYQSEHDSEDSNAESYYQNSYPDTDYSDDMEAVVRDFAVDCNLSSDDDYEDKEDEPYALDMKDVEMHGYKYARYKQRMKPLLNGDVDTKADDQDVDLSNSDSDEEIYPWNNKGNLVYHVFKNTRNA